MANSAAIEIHRLHQIDRERVQLSKATAYTTQVFNQFCRFPIITVANLVEQHKSSKPKAQRAMDALIKLGIVSEISGKQRHRKYAYGQYLSILTRDTIS